MDTQGFGANWNGPCQTTCIQTLDQGCVEGCPEECTEDSVDGRIGAHVIHIATHTCAAQEIKNAIGTIYLEDTERKYPHTCKHCRARARQEGFLAKVFKKCIISQTSFQEESIDQCDTMETIPIFLAKSESSTSSEKFNVFFGAELSAKQDGDYIRHFVMKVEPDGIASQFRLGNGDELLMVNHTPFVNTEEQDVLAAFGNIQCDEDLVLIYRRILDDDHKYRFEYVNVVARVELSENEGEVAPSPRYEVLTRQPSQQLYANQPNTSDNLIQVLRDSYGPEKVRIQAHIQPSQYLMVQGETPQLSYPKSQDMTKYTFTIHNYISVEALDTNEPKHMPIYVSCISKESKSTIKYLTVAPDVKKLTMEEHKELDNLFTDGQGQVPKQIAFRRHNVSRSNYTQRFFETVLRRHCYVSCNGSGLMLDKVKPGIPLSEFDNLKFNCFEIK